MPGGLALIQDDANFIAFLPLDGGHPRAIPLPAGAGGLRQFDDARGNKKHKLDLEACVAIDATNGVLLLALGSGSKRRREQVALVRGWEAGEADGIEVRLVRAPLLYESLRRERAFAGSELNIEGAVWVPGLLRLFGRGNGAVRGDLRPVNATCDLDWPTLLAHLESPDASPPPIPANVTRYELGALDEIPLTFTDAAVWGGSLLYAAAAEASPDATRDGKVSGSALGVIDDDHRARWSPLVDRSGAPFAGKVEGLAAVSGTADRVHAVLDPDDAAEPTVLCTVELRGSWATAPR